MNWILFGFKGAGKTHFAKKLGFPMIDTDELIETHTDLSCRQLYLTHGETAFRAIEKEIVLSLTPCNHVIATGGGTVLDHEVLSHLHSLGTMIYLKCPKAILKKRFDYPGKDFEELYCTRIPKYEKIPSHVIDMKEKPEAEVIQALWDIINLETHFGSPLGENPMEKPLVL